MARYHHLLYYLLISIPASSDVGEALVQYAKENQVDLVVVGSRGLGAWQNSFMGLVGLGSVSEYM